MNIKKIWSGPRRLKLYLAGILAFLCGGYWDITKVWERLTEGWQVKILFASAFTYLFGEYNAGMGALVCLVAFDWLTKWWALSKGAGGFGIAWETNVISSRGMRDGLGKILWYMILLITTHQLDSFSFLGMTVGNAMTEIMCAYLGLIEAKSILENLRDTGMKGLEPFIGILGEKQKQLTGKKD